MDHLDTKQNYGAEAWRKPAIPSEMTEIYSECGRVIPDERYGGICYRAFWLVLAKPKHGNPHIFIKHGGGEESFSLGHSGEIFEAILAGLDSNSRYLALFQLYKLITTSREFGEATARERWAQAFAEGRIKKRRKNGMTRVEIEPRAMAVA